MKPIKVIYRGEELSPHTIHDRTGIQEFIYRQIDGRLVQFRLQGEHGEREYREVEDESR
jgi:hypothetical protein